MIQFGHNFHYVNETILPPQLFDTVADPRELQDVANSHPDVVKAMTATLETELGSPLEDIEKAMMAENLENYNRAFFSQCTGESLTNLFVSRFKNGASREDIIARVVEWSGKSPMDATGTKTC